jgi:2-amino-1-hydroxyethylphosphonate dioxygenase (glycine-forming)
MEETIQEVFGMYEKFGSANYIGEPVSQIEHMSQSAELAMREGYDDEVVLAAFFHDIGHICVLNADHQSMNGYGVHRHEKVGADYLRKKGFGEKVAMLVENHVQAKRYLTFRYPGYFSALSDASKITLEYQGGRMSQEEASRFEKHPFFEESILMRKWDELAKEVGKPILNLDVLKDKARTVLARHDMFRMASR